MSNHVGVQGNSRYPPVPPHGLSWPQPPLSFPGLSIPLAFHQLPLISHYSGLAWIPFGDAQFVKRFGTRFAKSQISPPCLETLLAGENICPRPHEETCRSMIPPQPGNGPLDSAWQQQNVRHGRRGRLPRVDYSTGVKLDPHLQQV